MIQDGEFSLIEIQSLKEANANLQEQNAELLSQIEYYKSLYLSLAESVKVLLDYIDSAIGD